MKRKTCIFIILSLVFIFLVPQVYGDFAQGKRLIAEKKYKEAESILAKEYKRHPRDFDKKLYYSISLMGQKDTKKYLKGLDMVLSIWEKKNNKYWNSIFKRTLGPALCSHPRLTVFAFIKGVEKNYPQFVKLTLDNHYFKTYAMGQDWGAWMQKVINLKKYMFDYGKRDYDFKGIHTDKRKKLAEVKIMFKGKRTDSKYNVFTLKRTGGKWRISDIKENFEDLIFLSESEFGSIDNTMLDKMGYKEPDVVHNSAFKEGEYLVFSLHYMGMKAGFGTLEVVEKTQFNGKECYHIRSRARSASFFDFFYKIRNVYESYMDVTSFASLKFIEHQRESKHKADREIIYYQENSSLVYKNKEYPIPRNVKDVLASFYYVRAQSFKVGDEITLLSNSKTKNYKLTVTVVGEERLDTVLGNINTLIIQPNLKYESGIFKATGKLHIWVTDDVRHIPVQIKTNIKIGNITGELIRYSNKGEPKSNGNFENFFKEGR
ncbi:DUF3108 domain-containing protein [Candidatus Dependentiae bacterium]|nr:DUF3108 domain-containing protein [Candidatus Dependentiae bacterium]